MTHRDLWSGGEGGLGVAAMWEHRGWLDRRRVSVFLLSHSTEGHRILWASDMSFVVWSKIPSVFSN